MAPERPTGSVVEAFTVRAIRVTVRYGCVRRDQYELEIPLALRDTLRERLAALPGGTMKGSPALFVVDVEGVHQITVATARGRIVVMPRLRATRPEQRAAVLALCATLTK